MYHQSTTTLLSQSPAIVVTVLAVLSAGWEVLFENECAQPVAADVAATALTAESGTQPRSDVPQQPVNATSGYERLDNGPPDGSTALSQFEGVLNIDGDDVQFDRVVADDFVLPDDGIVDTAMISGVWFSGADAPGPLEGIRVRIWLDDGGGTPHIPVANTLLDEIAFFAAENTGDVYFDRPEVRFYVEFPTVHLSGGQRHWISVQPIGTTDNFFQLTSANGADNLNGEQVHLRYTDGTGPCPCEWPTPGHAVFDQHYDVSFKLFGVEGPYPEYGACCRSDGTCTIAHSTWCAHHDGAYHGDGTTWIEQPCASSSCIGDLNGDGVVHGGDLLMLLANWGNCGDCDDCPADFSGDCAVDGADFLQLLANWGECPSICNCPEIRVAVPGYEDDPPDIQAQYDIVNRSLFVFGDIPLFEWASLTPADLLPDHLARLDALVQCGCVEIDENAVAETLVDIAALAGNLSWLDILILAPDAYPALQARVDDLRDLGFELFTPAETDDQAAEWQALTPLLVEKAPEMTMTHWFGWPFEVHAPEVAEVLQFAKEAGMLNAKTYNDRCCDPTLNEPAGAGCSAKPDKTCIIVQTRWDFRCGKKSDICPEDD